MISDQVRQDWPLAAALEDRDTNFITGGVVHAGQLVLYIEPSRIADVCRVLKDDFRMRLSGITGVDWWPMEPRFEVVYLVHNIETSQRLRLKCKVHGEDPFIESVTSVWSAANWYEREVFDLFGVTFRNHPHMRRIMMPDNWEGHPLQKNFPVHGHKYTYKDEGSVI
jgi:NADH-quinone oxidoreductase subunit C